MTAMLNLFFVTVLGLSSQAAASGGHDHGSHGGVTSAKVAELALHRVGKLVDLKKIDASFVTHFHAVQVTVLPKGEASGAAYKALVYQAPNGGNHASVEILMDQAGKALSHQVNGSASAGAAQWPSKDPLSIAENALHFVLDQAGNEALKPFRASLVEMNLTAVDGVAKAVIKSSETSKVLVVSLSLSGAVINSEIQ